MPSRKGPLSPQEEEVRQILVQTRQRSGLSQAQLAQRLGVSQPYISKWEHGDYSPSGATFLAWVRICRATAEELGLDYLAPDFAELKREVEELRTTRSLKLPPYEGDQEDSMGVAESALYLRLSRGTLYRRINAGILEAFRLGTETVLRRSDIEALKKELESTKG